MKRFSPSERRAWLESLPSNPGSSALWLQNPVGELLVVKANYREHWTLPGGVIEDRESPREAAIRETNEEIGLLFKPEEVRFWKVIFRRGDVICTYKFVFKAIVREDMSQLIALQESEISQYDFVSKERVLEGDRQYSPEIVGWAHGDESSYAEEVFDSGATTT